MRQDRLVGHACSDTRQEFILLSDALGVSSLVEMVAFGAAEDATENTVLGPFYVPGSPLREFGASILEDPDDGQPLLVRGRVTDLAGHALPGALLDVWQNASNRLYAVQDPARRTPTTSWAGSSPGMTAGSSSAPSGRCRTPSRTTVRWVGC